MRRLAGAALGSLLPLLGGCQGAVVGDWHMVEAAQNRQVFSVDRASFKSDSSFAATTMLEGVTHDETGTYEFNGFTLRMRPKGGGVRSYTASLSFGRLTLVSGKWRVVLERGKR